MVNLAIKLKGLTLANPVLAASGTFGYGEEYMDFIDLSRLGGIVVKGTTRYPREGNPYPRMAETASGLLNAVGLQNKGVAYFIKTIYPRISSFPTAILVNVSGSTIEEYVETAEVLAALENIPGIELNISCPNVKEGGMSFGTSATSAEKVVRAVRAVYPHHLMVKLSPNVTDFTEIAKAVEQAGAASVSLINTFLGLAVVATRRRPKLSTVTGGLSGPCIKPIALRMVWQTAQAIKIPVIGMGGITSATDAVEFMLAGASAVQVGTANFLDPTITVKIVDGIREYCENFGFMEASALTGALQID
jgi:dihydroorotate dehydrogenase (NAD+) catalytic subunit